MEEADKTAVVPQEAAGAALVEPPFEGAEAPDPIAEPGNLKKFHICHYSTSRNFNEIFSLINYFPDCFMMAVLFLNRIKDTESNINV